MTVYVTMIDVFMSGWGRSKGKRNKLALICDSMEEAKIVAENAKNRAEMMYVHITEKRVKPSHVQYLQYKDKNDMPKMYIPGAFKLERRVRK